MATYPGGVKTFTSKTDGVSVNAAADINDLQNEVNAIEDGLLNGSARLNSSNSTVTNLSVSGGSTLAKVEVSGGSTLATMNVTGGSTWAVRPVEPPPHMALAFIDAVKDIGSSATSTLICLTDGIVLNSSIHSTGTNPERYTPQSTGLYQFMCQVHLAGVPATNVLVRLGVVDSSGTVVAQNQHYISTIGAPHGLTAIGLKRYDALGGYAVGVLTNAGPGTSTLSISTGVGISFFSMVKL